MVNIGMDGGFGFYHKEIENDKSRTHNSGLAQ